VRAVEVPWNIDFPVLERGVDFSSADLAGASLFGSTCTRTAYLARQTPSTWATPSTMEMRCATMVSRIRRGRTGLTGWVNQEEHDDGRVPGFTCERGRVGIPGGSQAWLRQWPSPPSTVAPSISRLSRIEVMLLVPWLLLETMESRPAIEVNWRSRGVATAGGMVSVGAGRLADTVIVGLIDLRESLTGSADKRYPNMAITGHENQTGPIGGE